MKTLTDFHDNGMMIKHGHMMMIMWGMIVCYDVDGMMMGCGRWQGTWGRDMIDSNGGYDDGMMGWG